MTRRMQAAQVEQFGQPLPLQPTARSTPTSSCSPLSAINSVFERLAKGEVPSGVVLNFAG